MASFISTVRFTQQGMEDIKATCQRAAAFEAAAKKLNVEVKHIFWTFGPFDGLVVFEAPDDETATALMLHLGSSGNVQTQTTRAYQAAEMDQILAKLPG